MFVFSRAFALGAFDARITSFMKSEMNISTNQTELIDSSSVLSIFSISFSILCFLNDLSIFLFSSMCGGNALNNEARLPKRIF